MGRSKSTKGPKPSGKQTSAADGSTNKLKPVWSFDSADLVGPFCFNANREDFDSRLVMNRLIEYGNMDWQEIMQMTHDRKNKTCNHFLDYDELSSEAKKCVSERVPAEQREYVFSLRLDNLHRIIGVRDGEKFYVKWYDPDHNFCPSTK